MTERSLARLKTCRTELQDLFMEVDKYFPCLVIEGHRGEAEQNAAFEKGNSELQWPNGKHNRYPSYAVDVAPLKKGTLDWNDRALFYYFAGYVMATAEKLGLNIRWGGDWDMDGDLHDQKLVDLPHFEVID